MKEPVALQVLAEQTLHDVVDSLVLLVEAAGAAVILLGAAVAIVQFVLVLPQREPDAFVPVRLTLGRFLALGLEFQLASDVLRTAVAPTLREIGELAAIAAIRTALNYFLSKEIKEEQEQLGGGQQTSSPGTARP